MNGGIKLEEIAKKDGTKNISLSYPINKRKFTDQKTLSHKLYLNEEEAFITAKSDITTYIDDSILSIETLIRETHNSLIVSSELPKLYTDNINIDITSHRITLKGEAKKVVELGKRNENRSNRLNKNIFLPKIVVPGKAIAEIKNEILMIKLPKAEIEKIQKFNYKSL